LSLELPTMRGTDGVFAVCGSDECQTLNNLYERSSLTAK
jgi:hypothetical protein